MSKDNHHFNSLDSFGTLSTLNVGGKEYKYFSLLKLSKDYPSITKMPNSLKVLLENLLRYEDGETVTKDDIISFINWAASYKDGGDINYRPARVLMQDFTGVPGVVDLAAMRDAVKNMGGDPSVINPLSQVDLVIDHSVMVDFYGTHDAFKRNVEMEFKRNQERYKFLHWGQKSFANFRVVPPGTGICHQVNLEHLGRVVLNKDGYLFPDTLVGTDSHTTMINGLGILGWGVGGIEAEAAMLGQPISMRMPEVIGFKLSGELKEGNTATDLVLTVTQMLRQKGVVGKFVEFYGPGLKHLSLADRATISNMAPEYGATCGFFGVDDELLNYLELTGRGDIIDVVRAYADAQGMNAACGAGDDADTSDNYPIFTDTLELDISTVETSMAGPKRPQDRVSLSNVKSSVAGILASDDVSKDDVNKVAKIKASNDNDGHNLPDMEIGHGDVVIAAITSCTNTSNPSVMIAAGLVAKKARQLGINVKPWVKTSLAPGSQVVTDYLERSGLQDDLDALGFELVGYGCTTCIGNSGKLLKPIADAISEENIVVGSVLSGNRNFEGRVHPLSKLNYLASPPLVVAYAIAGSLNIDLSSEPIAKDKDGNDVYLKDIWPSNKEIREYVNKCITPEMFAKRYADVFKGTEDWQNIDSVSSLTYSWDDDSTYVKLPPFFEGMGKDCDDLSDINNARSLLVLGDSVTTDHISPAGSIPEDSPAGKYLLENGIKPYDFNSYGSRRGNHEVMMRGTFANIRIRNEMLDGVTGGYTKYIPTGQQMSVYDAAMHYMRDGTDLVVIAGKEYGTGSSRDWAAKGTKLLGVKAVIAESFERIHRSNLVGMGVLPLEFINGENRKSLNITGEETFSIEGIADNLYPAKIVKMKIVYADGSEKEVQLKVRLDTNQEIEYYKNGGILHYVLRNLINGDINKKSIAS